MNNQLKLDKEDVDYINFILNNSLHKIANPIQLKMAKPNNWIDYATRGMETTIRSKIKDDLGYELYQKILMEHYQTKLLDEYKKIIDYAYSKNISLLEILNTNFDKKILINNSDCYELIMYGLEKNYFPKDYDFYQYFDAGIFLNEEKINHLIELSTHLPHNEKTFTTLVDIIFNYQQELYGTDKIFNLDDQTRFKKLFDSFSDLPSYTTSLAEHQNFYPSLVKKESFATFQDDNFFSKRFCFDFSNNIPSLETTVKNNLNYIYGNIFENLKEQQTIDDYYILIEQRCFYLYASSQSQSNLNKITATIKNFHQEIQPYLQNNTEKDFFYKKMFDMIGLKTKLDDQMLTTAKDKVEKRKI